MLASDSPFEQFAAFRITSYLGADLRDRTLEKGGAPRPHAEVTCNLRCEFCASRLTHQVQRLMDAFVGNQAEER